MLEGEHDRLTRQIDEASRALMAGEGDSRLVGYLRDRYEAREEIAFEQGKIHARLELHRDREQERGDQKREPEDRASWQADRAEEKRPEPETREWYDAYKAGQSQPEPTDDDDRYKR